MNEPEPDEILETILKVAVEHGILEHDGVDDEGRAIYRSLIYEPGKEERSS